MRHRFTTLTLTVLAALLCVSAAMAGERARPNIVVILSDDQRADMLSCSGNPYAKTPHLDRLAREGLRFDRAFVSAAVCTPSRASFLTGKHPHNAGAPTILHMPHSFHRNQPTFPARLHDAGYHTAHFGKWHLGEGTKRQPGFDHWAGYYACSTFHDPLITTNGKAKQYEGFTDFIVADMAAEHIERVAKADQPFFVFVGLAAPHIPFGYPREYESLFEDVEIAKPATFDEDFAKSGKAPFMKRLLGMEESRLGLPEYGTWENYVKSYYRSSQSIDESVGKILAALDRAGVADATMVIYSSDHGYALGDHGLTEKLYAYEGTMRVPMLVRYPEAVQPGSVRTELVTNLDVAPTCLELAGVEVPEDVEGLSLRPIFAAGREQTVAQWRSDVFYYLDRAHMAVRTARHKYITYPFLPGRTRRPHASRDESPELYDLERDPGETVNLVRDPAYAGVLADMKLRLARQVEKTGLTPREDQAVLSVCLLGPVPADREAAVAAKASTGEVADGAAVVVDGRAYTWRRVSAGEGGGIPIAKAIRAAEDERFLLGLQVELLAAHDPFVCVVFSERKAALRGWVDGELLYDRRTAGHEAELKFNWRFNPPLRRGVNTLVFAGAVADFPAPSVRIQTWRGKTRLVSKAR